MAATNSSPSTTARPASGASAPAGGIGQFFRDVRAELYRVTWPSRDDVLNLTRIVIAISLVVGAILGAVDVLFETLFRLLLQR